MDISIIIVNYKTPQLTADCVMSIHHALTNEEISYEVVVVDNHSEDDSVLLLKHLENEQTIIVESHRNGGFGYGNNLGAMCARGNYLFFLNSDTILYPNVLVNMWKELQNRPMTGGMGCLMVDGDNQPLVTAHSFENAKSLLVQTLIKPCIPRWLQNYRGKKFAHDCTKVIHQVDWVSGAALLMPRSVYQEIGGWNEKYFLYMEDEELCYRISRNGYNVELFPEIGLKHLVGKSGGSAFSTYERYKSKLMYYKSVWPNSFWFNKIILFIQAKQYMKHLLSEDRKLVLKKLADYCHEM